MALGRTQPSHCPSVNQPNHYCVIRLCSKPKIYKFALNNLLVFTLHPYSSYNGLLPIKLRSANHCLSKHPKMTIYNPQNDNLEKKTAV